MDKVDKIQILENLGADAQLRQLEREISEFNIFEALGVIRQELKHSDFLAYLLRPNETHGLGDRFLKQFLVSILLRSTDKPISPILVDAADFSEASVERERFNIDLLIVNSSDDLRCTCVVENKIDASEHSEQLNKYEAYINKNYADHYHLFVFLTPDGAQPTNNKYIPFSYHDLSDVVREFVAENQSTLGTSVALLLNHYVTMLGRHIVEDSAVQDLARKLYRAHKAAIRLIIEAIPDAREQLSDCCFDIIENDSEKAGLEMLTRQKTVFRFRPIEWATVPELNKGRGWSGTDATILFECYVSPTSVSLYLVIGIVDAPDREIRTRLYEMAKANPGIFERLNKTQTEKWTRIHSRVLLKKFDSDQEEPHEEDIAEFVNNWQNFRDKELAALRKSVVGVFPL